MSMLTIIRDRFLKCLEKIEYGRLTLALPDGRSNTFIGSQPGPTSTIRIDDWSVLSNLARGGDTAFAIDYAAGRWDTDNLQNLITLALLNESAVKGYIFGSRLMNTLQNLAYRLRSNSRRGSRRNIQAHYDLGNDFYSLWLDQTMTYSAALYRNESDSLAEAQHNKYDRILDRLGSRSGTALEIGCGWGGFAERAIQRGDFEIKGITLSETQHRYATDRLQNRPAVIALEDYRAQTGKYDHIVSIEMFEAVGEKYWNTYFRQIASLLKTGGRALVQTITIKDNLFDSYRTGQDFVRSLIFPGGMLPSVPLFEREAAKAGLRINDRLDFAQDYARTLEQWLINFDVKKEAVKSLGYDENFIRLWRFYLAACAASFRTGRTGVSQFEIQHA